jgi:hypothetical protein
MEVQILYDVTLICWMSRSDVLKIIVISSGGDHEEEVTMIFNEYFKLYWGPWWHSG